MEIKIACKGADNIPLEELKEFQGDIKLISNVNLEKLKRNIINNGFSAPIFIWKNKGNNYILDGTQRRKALISLKDDNYIIPELPVVYIYAKSKKDAKRKLLAITSQYGDFQKKGLDIFLEGLNKMELIDEIRLTNIDDIDIFPMDFDPVGIEEQGRLDMLNLKEVKCPKCGHTFKI